MTCMLSYELQKEHGIKRLPVCRGDKVKIMCGTEQDEVSEVWQVYRKRLVVYLKDKIIENSRRRDFRSRGKAHRPFQPSNLMITELNLKKSREAIIKRKAEGGRRAAEARRMAN